VLIRLGLRAEECRRADCYWRAGDDVVFLEITCAGGAAPEPGDPSALTISLSARYNTWEPPWLNLHAEVGCRYLTHAVVQEVMARCCALDLNGPLFSPRRLTDRLTFLGCSGPRA
jgi:hypothetical protein